MKNILITRTSTASAGLAETLRKKGFSVFFAPLFTVEKIAPQKLSGTVSAAIITSSNACQSLEESGITANTKIFTVGKKTAQELERRGFGNVILSPQNSAESLFDLLKEETGRILYFRGSIISFDFAKKLKNIEEILAYKTHPLKNFPADFQMIPYDEVLIFSKNSLQIFHEIVQRNNLLEYFKNAQILCLSQQIFARARELGFKKIGYFQND